MQQALLDLPLQVLLEPLVQQVLPELLQVLLALLVLQQKQE